jgi:hypothetical protein
MDGVIACIIFSDCVVCGGSRGPAQAATATTANRKTARIIRARNAPRTAAFGENGFSRGNALV